MPQEGVSWKPYDEILTFEEIERFAVVAAQEGISRIRLTGGEPLVRKGVIDHVRRLCDVTGLERIALTTNATLLSQCAKDLRDAGLSRVNVSLDSLDSEVYSRVTRGGRLADVLAGIEAAFEVGFDPVKLNVVVVRSLGQDLMQFARMTFERPLHVRFIEYMPIGGGAEGSVASGGSCGMDAEGFHWTRDDYVPSSEILESLATNGAAEGLGELMPVARDEAPGGWGPARYYRFPKALGTIGVISPRSHHFCGECNRLRLTADGKLRACLFSDEEADMREVLRHGSPEDIRALIMQALSTKPESHSMRVGTVRQMSQIGG